MRQALQWRLLLEDPADGIKTPPQLRSEMLALTVEQAQSLLKAALATPDGLVTPRRQSRSQSGCLHKLQDEAAARIEAALFGGGRDGSLK